MQSSKKTPYEPTWKEKQEHEDHNHVVYRDWCPPCVQAKGLASQHRSQDDEDENAEPTISFDYGYMSDKKNDTMCTLVCRDRKTKGYTATVVDSKGVTN